VEKTQHSFCVWWGLVGFCIESCNSSPSTFFPPFSGVRSVINCFSILLCLQPVFTQFSKRAIEFTPGSFPCNKVKRRDGLVVVGRSNKVIETINVFSRLENSDIKQIAEISVAFPIQECTTPQNGNRSRNGK
jgi:hypothetical protein